MVVLCDRVGRSHGLVGSVLDHVVEVYRVLVDVASDFFHEQEVRLVDHLLVGLDLTEHGLSDLGDEHTRGEAAESMLLDEVRSEAPDEDAVLLLTEKRNGFGIDDEAVLTSELADREQATGATVAHHHDSVVCPDEFEDLTLTDTTGYNGGVRQVLVGDVEEPSRLVSRVDDERLDRLAVLLVHAGSIGTPLLSSSAFYSSSADSRLLFL